MRFTSHMCLTAVLLSLFVTGCGGSSSSVVRVAQPAVDDLSRALGRSGSVVVELDESTLQRLANQARTSTDDVSRAAQQADSLGVWQASSSTLVTVRTRVSDLPEPVQDAVQGTVVDTACAVIDGEQLTREDFLIALAENTAGAAAPVGRALAEDVQSLIFEIQDAYSDPEGDPTSASAVALLCFTAAQVQ